MPDLRLEVTLKLLQYQLSFYKLLLIRHYLHYPRARVLYSSRIRAVAWMQLVTHDRSK